MCITACYLLPLTLILPAVLQTIHYYVISQIYMKSELWRVYLLDFSQATQLVKTSCGADSNPGLFGS